MSVLTIGSTEVASPSEMQVGVMDISKAERNARGTLIKEKIATKQKLELGWKFLTAPQLSQILQAIDANFFSVTYLDPVTNSTKTGTFYVGDRNVGVMDIRNGAVRYKDIKFNLIER